MPGMGELLIILLIVLVVFGASKLPGIGDALGRSIKNFKRASKVEEDDEDPADKVVVKKELSPAAAKRELAEGVEDGEWEEVVVRRKKQKAD